MAIVAGIVSLGVRDGPERAAKVMIPSVVGLFVILAAYGATLSVPVRGTPTTSRPT